MPTLFITIFDPLSQFDLLWLLDITCGFNPVRLVYGYNEFSFLLFWHLSLVTSWLVGLYYISNDYRVSNFNIEAAVRGLVVEKNYSVLDYLIPIFGFIFSLNIVGLAPYLHTLTSQIGVTILFGLVAMFVIWAHAFYSNKISLFSHFLPSGAPLIILPFIIAIELISNLSRIISLSVRLFANMTSGHTLLKIIGAFGITALLCIGAYKILFFPPLSIIYIITFIEIIISFLQTYVFMTLLLIYISEQE